MENELYRQAILDAKAVRASAIANAKASLQEAFEPKIQEMLRMKLSEDLEEDYVEEAIEEDAPVEEGDHVDMTEAELDEILAELEAMEEGDAPIEEDDDPNVEESLNEAEEDEDAPEGEEEPAEDEPAMDDEEMEVTIKFSDLKDVLAPFVKSPEGEEGMEGEKGGEEADDALSLDEILAELEEEGYEHGSGMEEAEKHEEGEKVEEAKGHVPGYGPVGGKGRTGYDGKIGGKGSTGYDAGSKKLQEANETIAILSEKLQEINLLNAKLLYMNKIFKAKNLNESEKIRIVKSFDKAVSVKEVKNVYEILSESLTSKNKKSINESRGFASKPAGVAPKTPIVDSDPTVDRWQQLVFGNK